MYKLMIVDDEPLTRSYVRSHIGSLHEEWECAGEAADGEEALTLLNQDEHFDLIITDIKMPGMSGLELARELAKRPGRPKMIILSGYDEFALAKEAMQYGVTDYLLKPIVREELAETLEKMAVQLAAERTEKAAYETMLALSDESRAGVARNFLRAVVTDNHSEIGMLYPLLFRLKISLLEAEGGMLIVALDEKQLLEKGFSLSDQALFRYIVHQTATELTAESKDIVLFIDDEERTVLLVPGEDAEHVRARCGQLYEELAAKIAEMTGLRLWGAAGASEQHALQLNHSYSGANQALKRRLTTSLSAPPVLFYESPRSGSLVAAESGKSSEHEIVTKAKAYIHAHFAEPISLALIAEKLEVSAGYLSSLFHQNAQESYIKFLTRIRMEHAAELLRSKPSEKIYDIAEKVGYVSVKHFSYVFKQHFGMPPGEYQEKARG
ncbi:response regulator [Paenibacillus sp. HB172176]|uniref:response regulator n=1 Tax=Paenibacillus sp. HB172176 TaxID=2493690 RepID=UPI00143AD776|nr:response regulator [Paenibacillus sp. HB172176]